MARATALFLALRRGARAGAVFAQSVTPVRAIRSQTVLAGRGPGARPRSRCRAAVASIEEAVGKEAKVALYPGRPILASQLGAPALVERNAVVRMSYAAGRCGSSPRAARSTGPRAGEPVRVMNLASKQTVTGIVAADGSIEVGQ